MQLTNQELEECLKGINHRVHSLRKLLKIREEPNRRRALNKAETIQTKLIFYFEDLEHEAYIKWAESQS